MDTQILQSPFINIPKRKFDDSLEIIAKHHSNNGILTHEGAILSQAFHQYFLSNIPVDYWWRDMHNFIGAPQLKTYYTELTANIKKAFSDGKSVCFGGAHGTGKTMCSCCILKRIVETGDYSSLYVNLTDIINVLLMSEYKHSAREQLLNVDFLVIDELDQRFIGSENAADLFGRILEPIIRTRIQNRMPIIICTNSPKMEDSFSGPLKASISSLMNMVKKISIVGISDARQEIKKGNI